MQSADAQFFWQNHPGGVEWCQRYADTVDHPSRQWVVDAVKTFEPSSVLEVGCNCGPLLWRLQESGLDVLGIDINANAVAHAQRIGLSAIVGTVPDALTRIDGRSFDVVVSSYCLAYIDQRDLPRALELMLRVADKGVVLLEPSLNPGSPAIEHREQLCYVEWQRCYMDALADTVERCFPKLVARLSYQRTSDAEVNGLTIARLTWRN